MDLERKYFGYCSTVWLSIFALKIGVYIKGANLFFKPHWRNRLDVIGRWIIQILLIFLGRSGQGVGNAAGIDNQIVTG